MSEQIISKEENTLEGPVVIPTESKLQKAILKYVTNREIAKERKEENEILIDEIRDLFEVLGDDDFVMELPSGDYAHVTKKARVREVLDKETLANELQMSVDDIKTPFDFSKLTSDGKLTPKMIALNTKSEVNVKVAVGRKKNKPKKKKD